MATIVSLINMKGGVGKTTLAFNLAWYSAWKANLKVLAIDLDPQSNLSHYFMGAKSYLAYIDAQRPTIVEVFEQFSPPLTSKASPTPLVPGEVIHSLREWNDGSSLSLVPSRLELAWTLKNPTDKSELLPQFLAQVEREYDLIVIDCAPTESILTNAAYRSSRYVVVPVKPEFLATIGLPLLERSLDEFRLRHKHQTLEMAGISLMTNGALRLRWNNELQSKKSRRRPRNMVGRYLRMLLIIRIHSPLAPGQARRYFKLGTREIMSRANSAKLPKSFWERWD